MSIIGRPVGIGSLFTRTVALRDRLGDWRSCPNEPPPPEVAASGSVCVRGLQVPTGGDHAVVGWAGSRGAVVTVRRLCGEVGVEEALLRGCG